MSSNEIKNLVLPNCNITPQNYRVIDAFMSRSAQPTKSNIDWLAKNNVTDIISFRRDNEGFLADFNEQLYAESRNIKFHNIPSFACSPNEENVGKFLDIIEGVKEKGGHVHIHCMEGADRTGMYAYIYERLYGLKSSQEAYKNLVKGGWHKIDFPQIAKFAESFCKKIRL